MSKTVAKESNKDKALEQVLNDIEKQFGKGSIETWRQYSHESRRML